MPFISYGELKKAHKTWCHYAMMLPHDQHVRFDVYVRIVFDDERWYSNSHLFKVHQETIDRVALLLGDNGYAVFKAYVAREGRDRKIETGRRADKHGPVSIQPLVLREQEPDKRI